MIALALLPGFAPNLQTYSDSAAYDFSRLRIPFMVVSCVCAYSIKLFYFDVVDDSSTMQTTPGTTKASASGFKPSQHALSFQGDHKSRWRATLWIASHVMLVTFVCAGGVGLNQMLEPWDGFPRSDLGAVLRTRFLIAIPMSVILICLATMHALHKGKGHGIRRIGRTTRLKCRVAAAILIACLPCISFLQDGLEWKKYDCEVSPPLPPLSPPPLPPHGPPPPPLAPAGPAHPPGPSPPVPVLSRQTFSRPPWDSLWMGSMEVGSRTLFIWLLVCILISQLLLELYGRGYVKTSLNDASARMRTMQVCETAPLSMASTRCHTLRFTILHPVHQPRPSSGIEFHILNCSPPIQRPHQHSGRRDGPGTDRRPAAAPA